MHLTKLNIPGCLEVKRPVFSDNRGTFQELYNGQEYEALGLPHKFVQDNMSVSHKDVIRGLHWQSRHPQGKLVMVMRGAILDVAVDIRVGSPTFGKHCSIELSAEQANALFIPPGFAHGFRTLTKEAYVFYKCTEFYDPQTQETLAWNDPTLKIEWGIQQPTLSKADSHGRSLSAFPNSQLPHFDV